MMNLAQDFFSKHTIFLQQKNLHIANISYQNAIGVISELLAEIVNSQTVIFLSGAKTPKELYQELANQQQIHPGAVGMVDERSGPKFHQDSNEAMIQDSGLLAYLETKNIPFYPILQNNLSLEEATKAYEKVVRELFATFSQKIALLGIGLDGHTAGIPCLNSKFKVQNAKLYQTNDLVISHTEEIGGVKGRISLSFAGLSQMDLLVVAAFGEEKKEALQKMFSPGSEFETPARFFLRPDIAKKTLLITDQKI